MLADQRLRHAERVDQFVHAALRLAQLQHDGDPHRRGQRAQQFAGGVENLPRRRRGVQLRRLSPWLVLAASRSSSPSSLQLENANLSLLTSTVTCMTTHVKDPRRGSLP